jgi:polyketide biosynthesis acyl carrier protein
MDKQKVFEVVVSHARDVVPVLKERRISLSDSLVDLGANSIDRSEIVMMSLESLALRSALVDFAGAQNIGQLVDALHGKLESA